MQGLSDSIRNITISVSGDFRVPLDSEVDGGRIRSINVLVVAVIWHIV